MNSGERMDDHPAFAGGNREVREIWRRAGSVDLRKKVDPEPPQTFFKPRTVRNDLDHVFADALTAERVVSCEVDIRPVTEAQLSDHAAIVVDIPQRTTHITTS